MTTLRLVIYGLACFRLAVLLSDDSGPYRFIARFRSFLKREEKHSKAVRESYVAKGVECVRCNSVWFGMLMAAYVFLRYYLPTWGIAVCEAIILGLALSAIAILLNRMFPPKT